ncbi:hypothetical protein V1498_09530 [Peribacillus sp. SCS-26]|uniref:hypothetical protein n=1 Tax=Paraperibacillus marinus TaxID=3115295 RepID=UPI003905B76D
MAAREHVESDESLESYYIALCDIFYYYPEETRGSDSEAVKGAIHILSGLIFHGISIDGITIREMDQLKYEKMYKRFHSEIMDAIQICSKNEVEFLYFLDILDELFGAAIKLHAAVEKIEDIEQESGNDE